MESRSVSGRESVGIPRPAAVLVVDDDEEIREVVRGVLEEEGYLTIVTSNGEEALACLREGSIRIGLVLLDLLMPKMDGWEFQRQRQREPEIEAIPLVVVTAHGGTLRGWVAEQASVPVMPKPIDFNRLLQVVATYCS
jgi:CheY-like chemotaxis protein